MSRGVASTAPDAVQPTARDRSDRAWQREVMRAPLFRSSDSTSDSMQSRLEALHGSQRVLLGFKEMVPRPELSD